MKRLSIAGYLFVLSCALSAPNALARSDSLSTPELDQALQALDEFEVRRKPQHPTPPAPQVTILEQRDMTLELMRHAEDFHNNDIEVIATLSDGTPLKPASRPDLSSDWEFLLPANIIRWAGTPHNAINDNILDVTIYFYNPGMLGRTALFRRMGIMQGHFSYSLRIYFNDEEASTQSMTVNDVDLRGGANGPGSSLRVHLRSYNASDFYNRVYGGDPAFSQPGQEDEVDLGIASNHNSEMLAIGMLPGLMIVAEQGAAMSPVFQTVTSPTAAGFF